MWFNRLFQWTDKCFLPLAVGRCNQKFSMYYYDYKKKACLPFDYSGCDGNENKFNSMDECERRCEEPLRDGERLEYNWSYTFYSNIILLSFGRCLPTTYEIRPL